MRELSRFVCEGTRFQDRHTKDKGGNGNRLIQRQSGRKVLYMLSYMYTCNNNKSLILLVVFSLLLSEVVRRAGGFRRVLKVSNSCPLERTLTRDRYNCHIAGRPPLL